MNSARAGSRDTALAGRVVLIALLVLTPLVAFAQEKILDFPINWDKHSVYRKFLPENENGRHGAWSCGQVAHAMIIRYLAMHHDLQIQGSHFYHMQGTGQKMSADFDEPFRWDEMLPSLKGIPIDDPRADPVADFVHRFCVAMRTDWWNPNGRPWVSDYSARETMARYYGIDVSEYRRVPLAKWAKQHSWDAVYERINRDIDAGLPCELVVAGIGKVCHEVIITGYRKVGEHYEYTIHFGGPRYDPSKSFRLDRPILGWDDPDHFLISWGIKPYTEGERAPLYNTILQESGALGPYSRTDIVWNGSEYAFVMPSGRSKHRTVVFQRINPSGRATGDRVVVAPACGDLPRPAIAWGDGQYAVAWLGAGGRAAGIHAALLSATGERVLPKNVVLGSNTLWPGLAWSGSTFGLSYLDGNDVKLAILGRDGTIQRITVVAEGKAAPSIVWDGDRYAVACVDKNKQELCLQFIDGQGTPVGNPHTFAVDGARELRECRVASAGDGYGLAFLKNQADGPPVVALCLADEEGSFLPESLAVVSNPAQKAHTPDVSFHDGVFYVTYRHRPGSYGLHLAKISRMGKLMDARWLVHRPDSACHTQGPDGVNIMSFRNIPPGDGIEVVSCIVPRKKVETSSPRRSGLVGVILAGLVVLVGTSAALYLSRATSARRCPWRPPGMSL